MIRDDIKTALVSAMKGGDKEATQTIRLIQSAIKNRDIELRTAAQAPDDDALITEVLQKMIKQRRESVDLYRKGNREELAAKEEAEIAVIERFLPAQMDDAEAGAAVQAIIAELGASSMKDMGRVMGVVKERHASSIEPARASALVRAALVTAMKGGDKAATGTIRLIQSAIKNRDIELRTATTQPDDDLLVTEVLQKMIKQRRESVDLYRKGNREELAAKEEAEIAVIERFLPAQMDDAEAGAAVQAIIAELGASSMKDMGRVMGVVKERHASSIEPARASALVRAALAG